MALRLTYRQLTNTLRTYPLRIPMLFAVSTLALTVSWSTNAEANFCSHNLWKAPRQLRYLNKFQAQDIVTSSILRLALGVYRVETPDGRPYVLRLGNSHHRIRRESFAQAFLRQFPHLKFVRSKILSPEEADNALNLIWNVDRDGYEQLGKLDEEVSVAPFFDLPTGASLPGYGNASDKIRAHLNWVFQPGRRWPEMAKDVVRKHQRKLWAELGPDARRSLIRDLKFMLPETQAVSETEYLEHLLKHFHEMKARDLSPLFAMGLKDVPGKVRSELADFWVLYTILGLPDFHASNWLFSGSQLIAIDQAYVSKKSDDPTHPIELPNQMHPYGENTVWGNVREVLLSDMSPKLVSQLRPLTERDLRRFADESGYHLTNEELAQIMLRIQYIVNSKN